MKIRQAMIERHSVRRYLDKPIDTETVQKLQEEIDRINREENLHFQLILNEPLAFKSGLAHYGGFSGVNSYLALIGPKSNDLDMKCGYYGERLVLFAQMLGLNTCWVASTYKKIPEVFSIDDHEKLVIVISLGYGETQGKTHRSKSMTQVSNVSEDTPEWFKKGVEAALLAPTAINQQQFYLTYKNGKVEAKAKLGPCNKIDLGIIKYHFEIGADKDSDIWL